MELTHVFTVPVGIDQVWSALSDVESVAACLPDATRTSGTLVESDESAHRLLIDATGTDKDGGETTTVHLTAALSEADDGTSVQLLAALTVAGAPTQDLGDEWLGAFADSLEQKLSDESDAHGTPAHRMHNVRRMRPDKSEP